MTTRHGWRRVAAAATTLLMLAPLGAAMAPTASAAPGTTTTLAQTAEPAQATATGFLYYMFPLNALGEQACRGVATQVTDAPYYAHDDCGFVDFTLSGTASKVEAKLVGENGQSFATVTGVDRGDGTWRVDIQPAGEWPAGQVRMEILADGKPAGETVFGHNQLSVTFSEPAKKFAPGEEIPVSGTLVQLDNDSLQGPSNQGVKGQFTLTVTDPAGDTVGKAQTVTTAADGTFTATIPAGATGGVEAGPESAFETVLAVTATDATAQVADSTWAAEDAGSTAVTLVSEPDSLLLENSFVSSVGWVKPGDTYPSRIFVKNFTDESYRNVTVTVPAPDGATFTQVKPGADAGSARITKGRVVWDLSDIPAAGDAGPAVRTLVLESKADTLKRDPELVWKDLSSTATLRIGTDTGTRSTSHGPKVIPPSEAYDTARYGDRPFPVVPVDYLDRKHQPENSGGELSDVINSPSVEGSTFNLFQEMSLGQLFPHGTVPAAETATADFAYKPGFDFTAPEPAGTCSGWSFPEAAGSPLYPERIKDGFYQLPGTTAYYGADKYGTAVAGAVAGVGALMDIDSACGPTGKLVYDSAAIADPEIDYSDYDTDKDGVVDFFMVVFAGCGGHGASQLSVAACPYPDAPYDNVWPHSSSLEFYYTDEKTGLSGYTTDDQLKNLEGEPLYYTSETRTEMTTQKTEFPVFVRVGPYNVNPETAIDKASVISHEYGHSLGLPDFYSLGGRETYGDWNLMATDKSQNMDVFSRQEMGWIVPKVLEPGETKVTDWTDSKQDTDQITWKRPDGSSYTLRESDGPSRVQNAEAYVAKLPGRQLIDPAKFETGDKASGTHAWWSGSGNDFGCPPTGGHNLDIAIPGLKDLKSGTTIKLEFKSLWDIEWDYDYGFVLTSTDGGENYTSNESEKGYSTSTNPNANTCQQTYGNGLTGSSGSYAAGTQDTDRLGLVASPEPVFLADSYDISELAGSDQGVLRFSYATDPGLARPGWFVDDLVVTATLPDGQKKVLLETDFEEDGGPDDPRVFNGGCKEDLGSVCTKGWNYIDSSADAPADHAYYLELRDRSGFDLDSNGENDRDPIGFAPGLSLVYTDEAHGYGNVGTDNPPAQSPIDANPEPGSDTPDLNDAAFTLNGKSKFSDSGAGHTDNYSDPAQTEVDSRYPDVTNPWRFQFDCLTFDVTDMVGTDLGPQRSDGNLTADVTFKLNKGCGTFDYGFATGEPAGGDDNGGSTGGSDGPGWDRVNCESAAVVWRGSWLTVRNDDAVGNRYCKNRARADRRDVLTMRFTGPRLGVHYATARPGGVARVVVDGERVGRISFRGDTKRPDFGHRRVFRKLGRGTHTVRLIVSKKAAYVDHFTVPDNG